MNNFEGLLYTILYNYDAKKSSAQIANIVKKVKDGGTYKEIYEFARQIGLGEIIKKEIDALDWVNNREEYEEMASVLFETMKAYSKDINDLTEIVQKSINDKLGINIAPQKVTPKNEAIQSIIEAVIGENGKIENLESELISFGVSLTDSIIKKNADIQSKSGFDIVVVRAYDDVGIHNYANYADVAKRKTIRGARVCSFCKEREGVYNYEDARATGSDVWIRHKGCSCSIDFVNKGMTERVNNYVKW